MQQNHIKTLSNMQHGCYKGIASHGLYNYHNGTKFITYDDVNDRSRCLPCAIASKCGWWYYACDAINPYERPPEVSLPNSCKPVIVDRSQDTPQLLFSSSIVVNIAKHCSNSAYR